MTIFHITVEDADEETYEFAAKAATIDEAEDKAFEAARDMDIDAQATWKNGEIETVAPEMTAI